MHSALPLTAAKCIGVYVASSSTAIALTLICLCSSNSLTETDSPLTAATCKAVKPLYTPSFTTAFISRNRFLTSNLRVFVCPSLTAQCIFNIPSWYINKEKSMIC